MNPNYCARYMPITAADLIRMQARLAKQPSRAAASVSRERDIHDEIEQWLRQNGWWYCHSRMDKRTTTARGVPDFICAGPNGITIYVEVKKPGGKLTLEQAGTKCWLQKLGHKHAIVYSLEDFLKAVK